MRKKLWDIFIYKDKPKKDKFELLETKEDDRGADKNDYNDDKDSFIYSTLEKNLERLENDFKIPINSDITVRKLKICGSIGAFLIFVDGLVNRKLLDEVILKNLMTGTGGLDLEEADLIDMLINKVVNINDVAKENRFEKIENDILSGFCALFIEGFDSCVLLQVKGYEKRGIEKPENEIVVRGSHESFVEDLPTNLSIVRRLFKNRNIIVETMIVGAESNLKCAVIYQDGVVNPELPKEVKKRISKVKSQAILSSGMLEQYIEDNRWMLFPQIISTERPDRAISFLLEGKVLVILDGSPFACAMPITFFTLYHTSADNNLRWYYGSFISMIRMAGILIAVFLSSFYIALILFSQEMISSELLASIASAREGVPFPTIVELVVMELAFELVREAALRVPGVINQTLGIVGALILGQAAVQAGLVSPILIIIVAATGIGSFTIPDYPLSIAIRISRFFFIALAYMAGFYGISIGMFMFFALMCSMKSFGVPFLAPVTPKLRNSPDIILAKPIKYMKYRPDELNALKKKKKN
ncbi:spore germination protein [Lutispora sp.]|uniref:spore germination protein n=1 Tax=Lutispora sp. TaxID=2828727 RepID=UPI002B22085A|nr:spore germination protein [Lutispora sp.]MEA4963203.1 spore germination protein [Lutispora sp.]